MNKIFHSKHILNYVLTITVLLIPVDFWYKPYRYTSDGMLPIPQTIRAILLALLIFLFLKNSLHPGKYNNQIGKVLSIWLFFMIFHAVFNFGSFYLDYFYIFKSSLFVLSTIVFYRATIYGYLTYEKAAIVCTFVIFFASIYALSIMLDPKIEPGQNVGAYIILWCLPFLLDTKIQIQRLVLILGIFAIIATVKRGPLLAMVIGLIAYFFIRIRVLNIKIGISPKKLLFPIFIIFSLIISFLWQYENYVMRFQEFKPISKANTKEINRMGSGRVLLAKVHLKHYAKGTILEQLFGYGNMQDFAYYAKYRRGPGLVAHSTIIETIHNYGVTGVFLLLSFFYILLRQLKFLISVKNSLAPMYATSIITFSLSTIYSSVLFSPTTIYFALLIGYVHGTIYLLKISNKNYIYNRPVTI